MSPTRLAWNPLRAKTRTAASRSCRRLSSTAAERWAKPLLGRLAVRQRRRRRCDVLDRAGDPADGRLQLARDDPDLVRLALCDLRESLEVLVREQLRVGLALVEGAEDGLDRLGLALGFEHRGLLLAFGLQDR